MIPSMQGRLRAPGARRDSGCGRILATVALLVVSSAGSACSRTQQPVPGAPSPQALPPGAEGLSLLGTPLVPPPLSQAPVAAADSALAAQPDDPDRLLAAATARATAWRFRDAIALYTRGAERWPQDARFLRFRGHRYLTLRQFEAGARDLDRAAQLDSTNFDVVYHQGLAHFLLGHYARAFEAYDKCLGFATNDALHARERAGAYRTGYRSCMRIATDDDSRVAMTDWAWRAATRAGRSNDASRLLATIREGMTVNTNRSYYENLLMYKGVRTPDQVLRAASSDSVRFSTSGYAVGQFLVMRGDSARGWELLDRVARGSHWNGFGVIGAEVEVVRRRGRR
jgi:tetratricopeptide (TPR) repeat protein